MTDDIAYCIIRSKRKSISISIDDNCEIKVRAPYYVTNNQISLFIKEKSEWINRTIYSIRKKTNSAPILSIAEGSFVLLLGQNLLIRSTSILQNIFINKNILYLPAEFSNKMALVKWYEDKAKEFLTERAKYLSVLCNLKPKTIRISKAKSRWGSMSSKGTLSLNRCLIICPEDVIDYVIIHELCHIIHPNHSSSFWYSVKKFMPNFADKQCWLKQNSLLINYFDI